MKNVFHLPFLFLFGGFSLLSAQSGTDKLSLQAGVFLKATQDQEWETVADMLYPKLFELAPREQIIAAMQGIQAGGFEISLSDPRINSISDIETHGTEKFAVLKYQMHMTMNLQGEDFDDAEAVETIVSYMKSMYGEEKVNFDKASKTLSADARNTMVALAPEESEDWAFLEYKPELDTFLGEILAEGLLEKIKEKQ